MVARDELSYRHVLAAIRDHDGAAWDRTRANDQFWFRVPGQLFEIAEVRDDPTYPVRVPVAHGKIERRNGEREKVWISVQFLRPQEAPLPRGEFRLPVFVAYHDRNYAPAVGDSVLIFDGESRQAAAAEQLEDLNRYAWAEGAKNKGLMATAMRGGKVFLVAEWTRATVVDATRQRVGKATGAIRVRLEDKSFDSKAVWIDAALCSKELKRGAAVGMSVMPYETAKRKGK
jgi:hypothetical protein